MLKLPRPHISERLQGQEVEQEVLQVVPREVVQEGLPQVDLEVVLGMEVLELPPGMVAQGVRLRPRLEVPRVEQPQVEVEEPQVLELELLEVAREVELAEQLGQVELVLPVELLVPAEQVVLVEPVELVVPVELGEPVGLEALEEESLWEPLPREERAQVHHPLLPRRSRCP